ncbi:MAG: benzoate-CoA ligase family protein [Hyphomicrobiaceae bacterium]
MIKIIDPVGNDTPGAREIGFDKTAHGNASSVLFDNLARNPDAQAITGPMGTRTYAELCAEAAQWGNAFQAFGLQIGDRIAFFTDDTPAYVAAFFGAVRGGFVPVLLNTQSPPDLLQYYLSDSGAGLALCDAAFLETFSSNAVRDTALQRVVVVNGDGTLKGDSLKQDAAAFRAGHALQLSCADTGPDDMAFWMYSSGSTGRPKGIVHLQHDMAYTTASYAANILFLQAGDLCFSIPKMFFAYGFGNTVTFPFSVGASSLLMPGRPEPARILELIETYRPSVLFGLPTLFTALCRAPDAHTRDLSSLRHSVSAAETLSEEVYNSWKALTGHETVEGLGSTELLHIYLSNTLAEQRLGSAGKRVPGYEVTLRDSDGNATPPGVEGVMWVRGHSSAPLYWNRPDNTAETMRGDWIYTGDRFLERDGFYYFQGRADDLVKVSGQWVWPLEVERCLAEHHVVHECAVIAETMADKRTTLRAVVRLRDGESGGDEQARRLQDYVKQTLQPHKYPRIVEFVDDIAKTGTGKIDRQALKRAAVREGDQP